MYYRQATEITSPRRGDKIWVRSEKLLVKHYGIYVGPIGPFGMDVIHNSSRSGVAFCFLSEFAGSATIHVESRAISGFEDIVVENAMSYLGQDFDLLYFNCEQFANAATGEGPHSKQLQKAGLSIAGVGIFLTIALANRPKYDSNIGRYRDKFGRFA